MWYFFVCIHLFFHHFARAISLTEIEMFSIFGSKTPKKWWQKKEEKNHFCLALPLFHCVHQCRFRLKNQLIVCRFLISIRYIHLIHRKIRIHRQKLSLYQRNSVFQHHRVLSRTHTALLLYQMWMCLQWVEVDVFTVRHTERKEVRRSSNPNQTFALLLIACGLQYVSMCVCVCSYSRKATIEEKKSHQKKRAPEVPYKRDQ